ncbi:GNAT family N-acetyltransferase [Lutimonas sp.]|jgi:predicted GNAT family N-acyltransferase|uniref:GNAT family N-acetyltransferase n=1 Tax=Lutimonas sp. TaxID=1872403 RepID=UPI003C71EB3F
MPEIIRIEMDDPRYQKERELRNKILLRPIGVPDYGWEMNDKNSWHFIAVEGAKVIGCVILYPLNEEKSKAQLMQMAVDHSWQGKGIGKLLVKALLNFATTRRIKEIEIHSRADVTTFYEQLGFQVYGKEFEEVGIKHRLLNRKI